MSDDTPIDELEVSVRTSNFLGSLGVETLGELLELPKIRAPRLIAAELEMLFENMGVDFSGQILIEAPKVDIVKVKGDLVARWKVIAEYLDERHAGANDIFRRPAAAADVAAAEKRLGRPLPDDYKKFMTIHDGQKAGAPMIGTCALFPVGKLSAEHAALQDVFKEPKPIDKSSAGKGVKAVEYSAGWIPIARSARGRDFLCIDLDPTEAGSSGQIISMAVDDDARTVVASSFTEMLSVFFEQVQTGEIELDEEEEEEEEDEADEDEDDD